MRTELDGLQINGRRRELAIEPSALAASCEGREITTIEGVSQHGSLAAIQKAYGDRGGGVWRLHSGIHRDGKVIAGGEPGSFSEAFDCVGSALTPEYRREIMRLFSRRAGLSAANNLSSIL